MIVGDARPPGERMRWHSIEVTSEPRHVAVACPDKFRGSLAASEAADAMARGLDRIGIETRCIPLADGGEGTLDALLGSGGGRRRRVAVTGPLGETVDAEYGVLADGTAVVEMAKASGLGLVADRNDP
ncbi:MAG TPA: glycerate kinase, partial [Acidimicrobiia bacterium]|nr:glycerate kinase [Acidimicrobiia bacterium]